MKMIGLLGGTSWPSTIRYYKLLNELVWSQKGGRHSANLLLRSIDFHDMRTSYENDWSNVEKLLLRDLEALAAMQPDCIMICNNTLHKAYDHIQNTLSFSIPVLHMIEETAHHARQSGHKNVLLLGTKMTMEDNYYPDSLKKYGLNVTTPTEKHRDKIQELQTFAATHSVIDNAQKYEFLDILNKYQEQDCAVLGCTELPLLIDENLTYPFELIDPVHVHCLKGVEFAMRS